MLENRKKFFDDSSYILMDLPKIFGLIPFDLLIPYDLMNITSATKSCLSTPINFYYLKHREQNVSANDVVSDIFAFLLYLSQGLMLRLMIFNIFFNPNLGKGVYSLLVLPQ